MPITTNQDPLTAIPASTTAFNKLNPDATIAQQQGQPGLAPQNLGATGAYTLTGTPVTAPAGSSGGRTLYDPASGADLANSMESSFESSTPYSDLVNSFTAAQGNTGAQYSASGAAINTNYQGQLAKQNQQNRLTLDADMTTRGLATNTALLAQQQDQADYNIKQINDQMNAALATNNTEAASALSTLATNEQTAITNARSAFLTNYFNSQTEARAEATFQTPEQAEVLSLAGQYPNAGISPTDSLDVAQKKVSGSAQYQLTQTSTAAQASANAAAAAQSSATAAQTRVMTSLVQNPNAQGDIDALLNNSETPDELQAKYANYPGGFGAAISAQILSEAQAKGYNLNKGTLTAQGQIKAVDAANSGGIYAMSGNLLNQAASWIKNEITGSPRSLTTPTSVVYQGKTYNFPNQDAANSFKSEVGM